MEICLYILFRWRDIGVIFSQNCNFTITILRALGYWGNILSTITQQTWWRAASHMARKPQLQHWWAHSYSTPHPTPISLHQCLPHHSTQNIPPLIGLCSSNMFVMKKQHIILSLLAGRAQFTKVEVGDKQRQYGCGVLRTMNHPAARVEQNIIESNISEHFHHN